jgi:hypothetical protein
MWVRARRANTQQQSHSHGGLVGFGAFGECSQSVGLFVESFGKLIGEQGNAGIGHRTP